MELIGPSAVEIFVSFLLTRSNRKKKMFGTWYKPRTRRFILLGVCLGMLVVIAGVALALAFTLPQTSSSPGVTVTVTVSPTVTPTIIPTVTPTPTPTPIGQPQDVGSLRIVLGYTDHTTNPQQNALGGFASNNATLTQLPDWQLEHVPNSELSLNWDQTLVMLGCVGGLSILNAADITQPATFIPYTNPKTLIHKFVMSADNKVVYGVSAFNLHIFDVVQQQQLTSVRLTHPSDSQFFVISGILTDPTSNKVYILGHSVYQFRPTMLVYQRGVNLSDLTLLTNPALITVNSDTPVNFRLSKPVFSADKQSIWFVNIPDPTTAVVRVLLLRFRLSDSTFIGNMPFALKWSAPFVRLAAHPTDPLLIFQESGPHGTIFYTFDISGNVPNMQSITEAPNFTSARNCFFVGSYLYSLGYSNSQLSVMVSLWNSTQVQPGISITPISGDLAKTVESMLVLPVL
jgi:hypothetical protein